MCGSGFPASSWAPAQDIVRHIPPNSSLDARDDSSLVSSTAGTGLSTASTASRLRVGADVSRLATGRLFAGLGGAELFVRTER